MCDVPKSGTVITYTIIFERKKSDIAVVLAETVHGERFLAHSVQPEIVARMQQGCPIGRRIKIDSIQNKHQFSLCD